MDKSRKTRWERQMRKLMIFLIILMPLLVGLAIWLIARLTRIGP